MTGLGELIRRGGRRVIFPAIGVIAAALALVLYATDAIERAELSTQNARFDIRGSEDPPDDLILVLIDDKTFSDLGVQWPFPRSMHGEVIERLAGDGAAQISYDVQFTEPTLIPAETRTRPERRLATELSIREDNALIRAVELAGHVVLSTTETGPGGSTGIFGGDAILRRIGARAGNTSLEESADGALRKIAHSYDGLESFPVATIESGSGEEVAPSRFPDGEQWIDYLGPPGTIPSLSYSDVFRGRFEPGTFEGTTVIVGASAPSLQDVHDVPTSENEMPGAEVQANAVATIAAGLPLTSTPVAIDVLLILALALIPSYLFFRLTPLRALAVTVALGALYLGAAQLAFNADRIVPVAFPMLGLAVSGVGGVAAAYLLEAFERQRARDTFARFVPEPVVGEVLDRTDEELRLGGREYEVTVLFSDIRGFTTFSESRPPDEVVDILNRYLGEMTDAIMDKGGTLVSFMGDGIMAVFGAPIEQPDHADRALEAAQEMLGPRLEKFNAWVVEQGGNQPFRMGVGLNSGPVMAGQVGSEQRLEYTTIGDTVNTASRLEGMTKGTPYQLFVGESTKEALRDGADRLEFVEKLDVRGRAKKIGVWTLPEVKKKQRATAKRAPAKKRS